ncbi:MAG TPA: haloacid dehalogenase-like hydrolase, partial [Acidimicrobiales bacterium]|nr:haloacid dehalogenase-like hydrolase [Acidimicrobiales bacterium]
MIRRLVLFDVDGTLLHAGGHGAAVFDRALEAVLGRAPEVRVRMGGKTDPQIVSEYLELMHAAPEALPEILRHLEEGLEAAAAAMAADGYVLPGVVDLLERLHCDRRVVSTVLTGNVAPNAVVKLTAFGLERWLDLEVGAYGSDDADRRVLVPVALRRVAGRHGVELTAGDTWVVGDTPRDLECAQAAGARCLLVGTGTYPLEELEGLGADQIRPSLEPV